MAILFLVTSWALAELVNFSLQLFSLVGRGRPKECPTPRPRFRKALWLDVLSLVDEGKEAGMDRLLQVMTGGADEADLKKGNVEAYLALQLFGADLAAVKKDPLMYHQLCSAIADLEKRRNKRFASGYAEAFAPVKSSTAASTSGFTPLAARLAELIIQLLEHCALLALGFNLTETGISDRPASSTTGSTKQSITWLVCTETHISHRVRRLTSLWALRRQGHDISIVDIGSGPTAQLPRDIMIDVASSIVIAEPPALSLLAESVRSGATLDRVIAIDPVLHPLFHNAAGCQARTDAAEDDNAALHTLCRQVRQISITCTSAGPHQGGLERYCKLRSVPLAVANRLMPLSQCISRAIDNFNVEVELPVEKAAILVTTPAGQQAEIIPVQAIPQSSLAMMPSLENISSIGMCLAPPLRTRQRSGSMGTVIGYGRIAGLPVDPAVVVPVRMGRQASRTSSWTAPVKV